MYLCVVIDDRKKEGAQFSYRLLCALLHIWDTPHTHKTHENKSKTTKQTNSVLFFFCPFPFFLLLPFRIKKSVDRIITVMISIAIDVKPSVHNLMITIMTEVKGGIMNRVIDMMRIMKE